MWAQSRIPIEVIVLAEIQAATLRVGKFTVSRGLFRRNNLVRKLFLIIHSTIVNYQ
jgi:hypothetical protein